MEQTPRSTCARPGGRDAAPPTAASRGLPPRSARRIDVAPIATPAGWLPPPRLTGHVIPSPRGSRRVTSICRKHGDSSAVIRALGCAVRNRSSQQCWIRQIKRGEMTVKATSGQTGINVGGGERIGSFVAGAVLIGRSRGPPPVGLPPRPVGPCCWRGRSPAIAAFTKSSGSAAARNKQRRGGATARAAGIQYWRLPRKVFRRAIRRPGRRSSARSRNGRKDLR